MDSRASASTVHNPLTHAWSELISFLCSSEPLIRSLALRSLDSSLLAVNTIRSSNTRKQLVRVLIDIIVGDEIIDNRMEASVMIGKLCCIWSVDDGSWLHPLAFTILKANFIQVMPHTCTRAMQIQLHAHTMSASASSSSLHRRTGSGIIMVGDRDRPISSRSPSPSPSPSTAQHTQTAKPLQSATLTDQLDSATHTAAMVCALESFGYLLDSAPACVASESDSLDDMFLTLLNQSDIDLFVKAQAIIILTTQLRHTYRNRRRIVKLMPAIKRIMSGVTSANAFTNVTPTGTTAGNLPPLTDKLHPYMIRVLSQFVSTWYCLPPDRLLRRFPAPAQLRGYAYRQYYKLTSSGGDATPSYDTNAHVDSSTRGHRKQSSSSFAGVSNSSSLSSSVYSLLDSDQLGWASAQGVDSLLQEMLKWTTIKTLLTLQPDTDRDRDQTTSTSTSTSHTPKTLTTTNNTAAPSPAASPPPSRALTHARGHQRGGKEEKTNNRRATVSAWNNASNASISISNDDDFVQDLLSQWSDLTFNLRSDLTVASSSSAVPPMASDSTAPSHPALTAPSTAANTPKGSTRAMIKGGSPQIDNTSLPIVAAAVGAGPTRSRIIEFDVKTSTRTLTLTNRSSKFAHDFVIQVYPHWLFSATPSWGTLQPSQSIDIQIRFQPSPLDIVGTKISGYMRLRSIHGFALERIQLLGYSGPSLKVLNAHGGWHCTPAASTSTSTPTTLTSASHTQPDIDIDLTSRPASSTYAPSRSSIIDFGICFLGVPKVQHIYIQNLTNVSTQASIFYLGPNSIDRKRKSDPTNESFSVIPSLLFLRPRETKRVSIIFYPRSITPVSGCRLSIFGLGEESYSFTLIGRGGVPLKVNPKEELDMGVISQPFTGTAKELAREIERRDREESGPTQIHAQRHRNTKANSDIKGIHRDYITIVNYNPHKSLPVSFRYNGQKYSMPSDGSDGHTMIGPLSVDSPSPGLSTLSDVSDFDVLYIRDTVVPPGTTLRIPVTLIGHRCGSFSKRIYINTPFTPTDSMSILVTAHIGPLLSIGDTSVINLAPCAINTAVHYVMPIVNLSKLTIPTIEVQGLKRTPVYFAIARMPKANKKPTPKSKRASSEVTNDPNSPPSPAAAATVTVTEELNDYFDPHNLLTCAIPNMGGDFLPSPVGMSDVTTSFLNGHHDLSFSIDPYETLLLHFWFLSHIPGFYVIPFQIRTSTPIGHSHTYGPIDIKAVCMARSKETIPETTPFGQTDGIASLIANEQPANQSLLQSTFDHLSHCSIQFRGDISSLSMYPFKRLSELAGSKAALSILPQSFDSGLTTKKSFAHEFIPVPSERFDEECKVYTLPPEEASGVTSDGSGLHRVVGVDYLLFKTPNPFAFQSTIFKLPPRLWLWRKKTLLLMLSNMTSELQTFRTVLTFPFQSTLCTEIDTFIEQSGGTFDGVEGSNRKPHHEDPNQLYGFKTTKVDLALLTMEEFAGQRVALQVANEKKAAQAEANEQSLYSPRGTLSGPSQSRRSSGQLISSSAADDSSSSSSSSSSVDNRRFRHHSVCNGFLGVIDHQNHLSICVLRGVLGDLVTVDSPTMTPMGQLTFNCTTPNIHATGPQLDPDVPHANPVTLYLKLRNHTDLNITFGFKFGSNGPEVLSTTVPTVVAGFNMLKSTPSLLTAYETRFLPITFAPSKIGKFQTDLIVFYMNPYQPSERFECFQTRLVGNYIQHQMVEVEGEHLHASTGGGGETHMHSAIPLVHGVSLAGYTSFIDCGTVIAAPTSPSSTRSVSAVDPTAVAAATSTSRHMPLTLFNTSAQELVVYAIGAPPFHVTAQQSISSASVGASLSVGLSASNSASSLVTAGESDDSRSASGAVTRRKPAWAERRAARIRQKSGMALTYQLTDEPNGTLVNRTHNSTNPAGDDDRPMSVTTPTPVAQLLQALNSIEFGISFRPILSDGFGTFAGQIVLSYLHYFKLIDCFGLAGQLEMESNWGRPTSIREGGGGGKQNENDNNTVKQNPHSDDKPPLHMQSVNSNTNMRSRFGVGFGGGMRGDQPPRHQRDLSMPFALAQGSPSLLSVDMISSSNRRSSMNPRPDPLQRAHSDNSAQPLNAIDIGLIPTRRIIKKPFHITNTGSMTMHIGRIDIVNVHSPLAMAGSSRLSIPDSTGSQSTSVSWTFAHTTLVRGAGGVGQTRASASGSPAATVGSSVRDHEYRQHTVASSLGAGTRLNVHARDPLNATMMKTNAITNSMRKRRHAPMRLNNPRTSFTDPRDGFTFDDLDHPCVDFDEVDYQLEFDKDDTQSQSTPNDGQQRTYTSGESQSAAATRRSSRATIKTSANRRSSQPNTDSTSIDITECDSDSLYGDDDAIDSISFDMSHDFPILLHPGHSLPLWIFFHSKDQPGTYYHEIQMTCIDTTSTASENASISTTNGAHHASDTPAAGDTKLATNARGVPQLNRRASLNSPLFIGTPTMMAVLGSDNKKSSGVSTTSPSSDLPVRSPSIVFKTFNFLLKVSAHTPLQLEGGFRLLNFGTIKMSSQHNNNQNTTHTTHSTNHTLAPPNMHMHPHPTHTLTSTSTSTPGAKSMTLSFVNDGTIPLHWRMMKLNVELTRVRDSSKRGTDDLAVADTNEARDGARDDEDGESHTRTDSLDEERIHENAFVLSPPFGLIHPKQRQTVTVTFAPTVPHIKYIWNLALATQEMSHVPMLRSRRGDTCDPARFRLVGIAGMSMLQLVGIDDESGLERPMPVTLQGVAELPFGCISIGCDRHKRFLLRNLGELCTRFSFTNSSQRFHILPTHGTLEPYEVQEIYVHFQPLKPKFYSTTVSIKWGSENQNKDGSESDSPVLSESLRLLMTGKGGLSEMHIPNTSLNFGTVTIHQDHVLLMRVQNVGAAEGDLTIEFSHSSVRLKNPSNELFVPAGGVIDIPILFHPVTLDPLAATATLRSPSSPSFSQVVSLTAIVGVPRLMISPEGILDYLDFGTCLTNTTKMIEFNMCNTGSVDLKFEVVFLRLKQKAESDLTSGSLTAGKGPLTLPMALRAHHGGGAISRNINRTANNHRDAAHDLILDELPSLTYVRHAHAHHGGARSSRVDLGGFFGSTQTSGAPSATTTQNELYYEDHMDSLEEFVPTGLSVYPSAGRINAMPLTGESSSVDNNLKLTLTFSPTQHLEVLECAMLIRSTHVNGVLDDESGLPSRPTSGFDSLYSLVRGLAGEQKLLLDSQSRHLDFGLCRIGHTYSKVMLLSNPGNIRVDFHIGPDLEKEEESWKFQTYRQREAEERQNGMITTSTTTPHTSQQTNGDPSDVTTAAVPLSPAPTPTHPPLTYSDVRRAWLDSLNAIGFDLIYSGSVEPGHTSTVTILYTPKDVTHVSTTIRIISNAKLETIDLEGEGGRSKLHLWRIKPQRPKEYITKAESKVDTIDFGLLPIIPSKASPIPIPSSGSSSGSAYRKLYWVYNSGNFPCDFLLSRNDMPPEFEVRPMEATVPPNQFVPLTITFNPITINRAIAFTLKFIGTGEREPPTRSPTLTAAGGSDSTPPTESNSSVSTFPPLEVSVCGSGGFGILGVCFLNESDIRLNGLDFDIVSVHPHQMVEKYFALYNCGSVPLRIKVQVDNNEYSLGIAGTISSLSSQIVDVVTSTPVDHSAIHNEIRYNYKLNKLNVTNTHHIMTRRGGKLISHEKAIGQSAFDYSEREDGTLDRTSRASLLTYLVGAAGSDSQSSDTHTLALGAPTRDSLSRASLPLGIDGATDHANTLQALAAALTTNTTSTSNPFTAKVTGATSIEEVLMPGKYIPIFVRLIVSKEKSYMCTVTVSSEHSFISIPVRADGGVVQLSHTGNLDFGTIGCFHRYTKSIVLRNSGTVPTRAKLFWNIRGSGQDASGGSLFALSGAKPFENPFINSDDEYEDEDDDDDDGAGAGGDVSVSDSVGASDGVGERRQGAAADRELRLMKQRAAARQRRKAQREAQKATKQQPSHPPQAVDTYKSIIRLYAADEPPPVQLNITRLWWQHCIKFIRILLRSYKMMYPTRAQQLFHHHTNGASVDIDSNQVGSRSSVQKATADAASAAADTQRKQSRTNSNSNGQEEKKQQGNGNMPPANATTAPPHTRASGGLEDYLSDLDRRKSALSDSQSAGRAAVGVDAARLRADESRIQQAVVAVAELDPNLREVIGGSPLDKSKTLVEGEETRTTDTNEAVEADTGMQLPISHPMYASALLLSQKGKQIESSINALAHKVHHRLDDGENPALVALLAAGDRLHLKLSHTKLPRIGDPGDGIVDMKTPQSAERVSQLRIAPSTILLGKESHIQIHVDINLPRHGNFNATLVVECELSGVERYEIPLRAIAAQVNFKFDDSSKLDFGRLPLGETDLRTRTVTNLSSIPVKFRVENLNPSLTVMPNDGVIPPGRRSVFAFTFRPVDETVQQIPIKIFTNCTPTITLDMFGAGGIPKLHIDSERLDFGRCMIGKTQTRCIRITNTGNAIMTILSAHIEESVVFHKGLKANAERDMAIDSSEQLPHTGAQSASGHPRRRRRGMIDLLGGPTSSAALPAGETFGLSPATLASATAKSRVRRSLYLPATAMAANGGAGDKPGVSLLSALGLPPAIESDSEEDAPSDDDDGDDTHGSTGDSGGVGSSSTVATGDLLPASDWPEGRFQIQPNDWIDLPIEFRPPRDDIFVGRLMIDTLTQIYPIELVGTGREALLVYDQKVIEFKECIVGNTYTKEFSLMNVGEVRYPVRIFLEDKPQKPTIGLLAAVTSGTNPIDTNTVVSLSSSSVGGVNGPETSSDISLPNSSRPISNFDLHVFPSDLILGPFEKKTITVQFTPTRDLKCTARLILDSIFSHNTLAVHMWSGTASLQMNTTKIDFGIIQQGHKANQILNIKNTGTLPVAYRIKPPSLKPFHSLPFSFSKWSGVIQPGVDVDIIVRAHLLDLGSFSEDLCIESDRLGHRYFFTVSGECARSYIDPSKFDQVNFGHCQVGQSVSQVIVIQNEGVYPLEYDMKFNYPLTVTPKSGKILGSQIQTFQVSWIPSGGYEMRTVMNLDTNIGVYDIAVRGVGAYPRFVLRDAYIDFGVCAFHHTYTKSFSILNTGKVAVAWSIPSVEVGYSVSPSSGILGIGDVSTVTVSFCPFRFGVHPGNFIVESEGRRRYREVNVVGIGGVLAIDYPQLVNLQNSACGQWKNTYININNTGDVTLNMKVKLDRTSIEAEPNSDDEEEEEQQQQQQQEHTVGAEAEIEHDLIPSLEHANGDGDNDVARDALVVDGVSRSESRLTSRRSKLPFSVRTLPSTLVIPPRTSASVLVRTFVPSDADGDFSFRLLLVCIEATLTVYLHGKASRVELSNYVKALILADRNHISDITRMPHTLQRGDQIGTRNKDRRRDNNHATSITTILFASTLSHMRLPMPFIDYQRRQLMLLAHITARLASVSGVDSRFDRAPSASRHTRRLLHSSDAESLRGVYGDAYGVTRSVGNDHVPVTVADSSRFDSAEVDIDTHNHTHTRYSRLHTVAIDPIDIDSDVAACFQCIDSIVTAITVADEHSEELEAIQNQAKNNPASQQFAVMPFDDADSSVALYSGQPRSVSSRASFSPPSTSTSFSPSLVSRSLVDCHNDGDGEGDGDSVSSPSTVSTAGSTSFRDVPTLSVGVTGLLGSGLLYDDVATDILRYEPNLNQHQHAIRALLRYVEPNTHGQIKHGHAIMRLLENPNDIID